MNEQIQILVVDDDQDIREAISIYLTNERYTVFLASDGMEAIKIVEKEEIHLIIMDVMMPNMDGIRATYRIREKRNIPILMLSAKSEDTDKIIGLQMGADDYLTKPFNPLELVARVKSQIRRYVNLGTYQSTSPKVISIRGLSLNEEKKQVTLHGEEVKLTPIEYKIIRLFLTHPGRVFSMEEVYEKVWEEPGFQIDNTVAVHIRKIREKIEVNTKQPIYIKVVWGIGYKIEP